MLGKVQPNPHTHCWWKILLMVGHIVLLGMTLAFNYMSTPAANAEANPLYQSNTGDISDRYDTKVTPAGWTFTIWAFIYIWQIAHAIYSLTLICRNTSEGHYLYQYPSHIEWPFYLTYIINMVLNTSWIFLFDREMMEVAFVFLFLIALTIYICGVILCRSLDKALAELERLGNKKDIWLTRILTLNGLAFYGTWCTIATLLNLSIVLQYKANVEATTCVWIALGILTAELLSWFILETFVFDRYLRYCFSQYIVLLVAFSGVLSKHYKADNVEPYLYYIMALMALSTLLALVKIFLMIYKGLRQPVRPVIYSHVITPTTEEHGTA